MLSEEDLDDFAANIARVLSATRLTHADQLQALSRASQMMAKDHALCALCHMFIPLHEDGPTEHKASCGLPCVPPGVKHPATPLVHSDMENCPICRRQ